jgi:hypothetical protein
MSSDGEHSIPLGAFWIQVPINVGDRGSSEKEAEAWREEVEAAERALKPLAPALTEVVDHYLRGNHPYRHLRDRVVPAVSDQVDYKKSIPLPVHRSRLGVPDYLYITLSCLETLPDWQRDKIAVNFCLSHLGPGGYLQGWRGSPRSQDRLWDVNGRPFCLALDYAATGDKDLKEHAAPDALMRSVFEQRTLPDTLAKQFDAATEPEEAWAFATTVWMFARDEDLEPWKTRCLEQAHRKFPEGSWVPEWARGSIGS